MLYFYWTHAFKIEFNAVTDVQMEIILNVCAIRLYFSSLIYHLLLSDTSCLDNFVKTARLAAIPLSCETPMISDIILTVVPLFSLRSVDSLSPACKVWSPRIEMDSEEEWLPGAAIGVSKAPCAFYDPVKQTILHHYQWLLRGKLICMPLIRLVACSHSTHWHSSPSVAQLQKHSPVQRDQIHEQIDFRPAVCSRRFRHFIF